MFTSEPLVIDVINIISGHVKCEQIVLQLIKMLVFNLINITVPTFQPV